MTFTNTYITKLAGAFFARSKILLAIAGILLLSLLVACAPPEDDDDGGGSADTYTIGGTVAGHTGEVSLKLTYGEETETLKIETGTDKFTFAAKLEDKQSFTIDVTAPQGQSCSSSVTQGTIVNANITNVTVTCSDAVATYTVSGSVTDADDNTQITITLSHGDAGNPPANIVNMETTPNADGAFTFDIPANKVYVLSVASATTDEVCTPNVTTFSEPITANVTDADIVCAPAAAGTYTVGGTISGLANGEAITLTLTPTGGVSETKVITGDAFVFNTRLTNGDTYTVTTTQPVGRTCEIAPEGEQTMGDAHVTNVAVTCVANTYSISGAVSGLGTAETITLTLFSTGGVSETEDITGDANESTDDAFAFDAAIAYGTAYTVTTTSPTGRTCTAAPAGTQTMGDADVTIAVTCVAKTYAVSGTVSGLESGETASLTLTPTGGVSETEGITGDASESTGESFAFDTAIAYEATYRITVASSPVGKTCTVDNARTRTMGAADVTDIAVTCGLTTYSVSGRVVGAVDPTQLTITLLYADSAIPYLVNPGTINATPNTDRTFSIDVPENKRVLLTVDSTTANEVCISTATSFLGRLSFDVGGFDITCSIPSGSTYSVGGMVSGYESGEFIVLNLSPTGGTAENKIITADADDTTADNFAFVSRLANGATYTVAVISSPVGKICAVDNEGARTMGAGDVTDIAVTCEVNKSIRGTVSGLANGETLTLTLSPIGINLGIAEESKNVTGDADTTTDDTFTFDTRLASGTSYDITTTSPTGKTCTVAPEGRQRMGDAGATIAVTCIATHLVSGTVSGAANNTNVYVVLTYYDDNAGTGGTKLTVKANADGTFTITGIPANKFYILQASSASMGETCTGTPNAPTQLTANVANARITCTTPTRTGHLLHIRVTSQAYQVSLITINVFIGDGAIPDTGNTATATRVIRGTDADVIIAPNLLGLNSDGFFYNVPIDNGKYYAVTATTDANETCRVLRGGSGGPVDANVGFAIRCE